MVLVDGSYGGPGDENAASSYRLFLTPPAHTRQPQAPANSAFRRLLGSPVYRAALCRERVSARVEAGLVSFGRSPARTGHGRVIDVGEWASRSNRSPALLRFPAPCGAGGRDDSRYATFLPLPNTVEPPRELVALRWQDLDLESGRARIRPPLRCIKGQGLVFARTKTHHRARCQRGLDARESSHLPGGATTRARFALSGSRPRLYPS